MNAVGAEDSLDTRTPSQRDQIDHRRYLLDHPVLIERRLQRQVGGVRSGHILREHEAIGSLGEPPYSLSQGSHQPGAAKSFQPRGTIQSVTIPSLMERRSNASMMRAN